MSIERNVVSKSIVDDTAVFLKKMIGVCSLSGEEEEMMHILKEAFLPYCDTAKLVSISPDICDDPLYCDVKKEISYKDRHNLMIQIKGSGNKTLILNAHADVVPAAKEMFDAVQQDDVILGRGACDDKGQIAAIYMLLRTIKEQKKRPLKSIEIHIVAEEEIGGNGSLAIACEDFSACLAIIMEPTNLNIFTGSRGAVWFQVKVTGMAGHSGEPGSVKNALLTSIRLMDVIQKCHEKIFQRLKGVHPFEEFENPMPLTFGKLHSGHWPATVPSQAVLEGVFGFLPPMTSTDIVKEILKSVESEGPELADFTDISFPLKRDPVVTPRELPIVGEFAESLSVTGIKVKYSALPACSDMWVYSNLKKIPSVIFGAGQLKHAHSDKEQVKLSDLKAAALSIYDFVMK